MASEKKGGNFVKLVSSDGQEFFLERSVACQAKTIESMFNTGMQESASNEAKFPEIEGRILEKVVQYLHYKQHYSGSKDPIPEFKIEPDIVAELLMASNYLCC